jgi:hypothetical protein
MPQLYFQTSPQETEQILSPNNTPSKVSLAVQAVEFQPPFQGKVEVKTDMALNNLTIVYRYTCLNGTVFTENIDYGKCIPSWGSGTVLEQGGEIPTIYFKIPEYIVSSSSSRTTDALGFVHFGVEPQIEILEIYGYTLTDALG